MTDFIFVRHGQSKANADKVIADAHAPLTKTGRQEAREAAAKIRDLSITFILSSPFARARQTAETIANELGIDSDHFKIVDALRERGLGVLENGPKTHDGLWYFTDEISEGIEPRKALLERMSAALKIIKGLSRTEKVLVVGHAISGFYLQQIADGHITLETLDPPSQMINADYVKVTIRDK